MKKKIEVVAAVIEKNGKIFCAKRPNKGEVALKWEFPGGKIEENETHQEALIREIKEELNSKIVVNELITTVYHEYKAFTLTMHAYYCTLLEGFLKSNEHIETKWVEKEELDSLDWAPADFPIIMKLKET